jgi:hypothetical protein
LKDGKPTYTYNWLGLKQYTVAVAAEQALPAGRATIRFEFTYDGGGVGKGGTGTLYINGTNVATGRIDQTQCCAFSADEGADVGGADEGTPVTANGELGLRSFCFSSRSIGRSASCPIMFGPLEATDAAP